jgi:hypothetical protein
MHVPVSLRILWAATVNKSVDAGQPQERGWTLKQPTALGSSVRTLAILAVTFQQKHNGNVQMDQQRAILMSKHSSDFDSYRSGQAKANCN